MPVKMVELATELEGWNRGAAAEGFGSRDAQPAPAESSHLMERLLTALTDPDALTPLMEDLALWTTASDHLQTCAICRSGLAALAMIGDTPEGILEALLAHVANVAPGSAKARTRSPRASKSHAASRRSTAESIAVPAPEALASYVAIVQANGVAAATKRLPNVARHLRGCPLCRRDVADALAALQALDVSSVQK